MRSIIYHGSDREIYCRIREGFPEEIHLRKEWNCTRLKKELLNNSAEGLIFPFTDTNPETFRHLKKLLLLPEVPAVVVVSPLLSAQQAVSCMRLGAADCFTGSVGGEVLGACFRKILFPEEILQNRLLHGTSPLIQNLYRRIEKYAALDLPVLITGETGSGKELAARNLHLAGSRKNEPFTAVNCGAYPEELLSAELFGTVKGAFTGAADRPGLFETSNNGTLFLDEIGELSPKSQTLLLRVLETKRIRRLGSTRPVSVDVRVLAATNQPLKKKVAEKTFRPDLYYRLSFLNLEVPPLRKRKEDIPLLAREYLNSLPKGKLKSFHPSAYSRLLRYSWPGNVRELQSVILKASLLSSNRVIKGNNLLSFF